MRLFRASIVLAAAAVLAGCGSVEPLRPAEGKPLPVKPLMARATPTPEELLTPPVYANPERIDELMKRSQPRSADRFDLPPPDGGAAPIPPPDAAPAIEPTGTDTPQ
jgi:hypothetical protein